MAQTEAQLRASKKYHQKFDVIQFRVVKGEKDNISNHAKLQGESLNAFLRRAVQEAIERDLTKVQVEQFVMAYRVEQDRLRAMLPEGFESLRPVLRINAEIRSHGGQETVYVEFNTPVAGFGKRGWMNIATWESPAADLSYQRNGKAVTFRAPFLTITYTGVGIEGGCPAEKDNDGCFFDDDFVSAESIDQNKEFCDCEFAWNFTEGDAHGVSIGGKPVAAIPTERKVVYEKRALTAQNAAAIPCEQILGSYLVKFKR